MSVRTRVLHGLARGRWPITLATAAYNLVRVPELPAGAG